MVRAAHDVRSLQLQVSAIVLALLGIVIGKYLAFVWLVNDLLGDVNFPIRLPVLSTDSWHAFVSARSTVWDGYDLLWVALAVIAAARVTARSASATQ